MVNRCLINKEMSYLIFPLLFMVHLFNVISFSWSPLPFPLFLHYIYCHLGHSLDDLSWVSCLCPATAPCATMAHNALHFITSSLFCLCKSITSFLRSVTVGFHHCIFYAQHSDKQLEGIQ